MVYFADGIGKTIVSPLKSKEFWGAKGFADTILDYSENASTRINSCTLMSNASLGLLISPFPRDALLINVQLLTWVEALSD